MRSWKVAVSVVVLAIVVVCGIWWLRSRSVPALPSPTTAAAPSAPAQSPAPARQAVSQRQLVTDITREGVTPDRARQLFSMVIGRLPGVDVPAGDRDEGDFDGTFAVLQIYDVWDALTPEQQQAVARLLGHNASARGTVAALGQQSRMVLLPVGYSVAASTPAFDYEALAKLANEKLATILKTAPMQKYEVEVDYGTPTGTAYAETDHWYKLPLSDKWVPYLAGCHIRVWDQKFKPLDAINAAAVVTHEMFHCYQQRHVKTVAAEKSVRNWVREGEATWVMAALIPAATAVVEKHWKEYIESPQTEFSDRAYDGVGIFGHLSDITGEDSVWPKLLPAYEAAENLEDTNALNLLLQGDRTTYFTSWGSSYFRHAGHTPWTMVGPGSPPTEGPTPDNETVSAGDGKFLPSVAQYTARITSVNSGADVAIVSLLTGYGRVHDANFGVDTDLDTSAALALCLKQGGCACPDGSPGASLTTKQAAAPLSIGLEGGDTMAQAAVIGETLDSFCKTPDKKPDYPPGPGGGGGGGGDNPPDPNGRPPAGSSHGDTHIVTFDGVRYDLQVVGEYTLVRSTKDDFAIQVRQVPVKKSKMVSVNQAVATRIGDRRVTISLENNAPVLRVDGNVAADPLPALSGGSIRRAATMHGTTYQLAWRDGTTATIAQLGGSVLNVQVKPAETRRGALAGLLGDDDGSPVNDLVGSGGVNLGLHPADENITHALADAWRITQAASLFDYQPGQSTATFVDPTFPDSHVDASRVPNRAAAEQTCRTSGITDPHLLENCIIDYAVTSDFLFASSYSQEQQVLAARARVPLPRAPGVLRTVLFEGTITNPTDHPSTQFEARAGDVIWVGNPDCSDNYMQVGLTGPDGRGFGGGAACAIGRRTLTASGTYTATTYRSGNPVGRFRVPIRFIRLDRGSAVSNNAVVAGRIETRAVHDVYTFEAHAGDVIRVSGEGCDIGTMVLGLVLPNGSDILGPSCRSGSDVRLTESGTYRLVVNAGDLGPDAYHFVVQIASSQGGK